MANSNRLTLPEVQAILRHADIQTTSRYLTVGVDELFDKLAEYALADIKAVFGA
jgi:hypothetical protein